MSCFRFGVYNHKIETEDENIIKRNLIVVRDEYGNIVRWTNFHKYARNPRKPLRSLYADSRVRSNHICSLLNFVFFEKQYVTRLQDLKADMVIEFIQNYGMCRLENDTRETHRSEETVNKCITHICDFIELLKQDYPKSNINVSDLFTKQEVFSKHKRKFVEKMVPKFEVLYKPTNKVIYRDLPEAVFQILMNKVINEHPNMLMLFALGAFAGLRPAEACNVRREDSPLGAGIRFEMVNGEVTNIFIDLTEEKNLRSDLVDVGSIKKERTQKVYPNFIKIFMDFYNRYMKYIEGKPYEAEYGALTNTSFGKAYTYSAYLVNFKKIVKECIPEMLASEDPQVVNYGHLMQEVDISPHILRHWFSVKLTLYGENESGLMTWRGDKSPISALTYTQNKSDLEKRFKSVTEEIFNYSLWKAEKLNGGEVGD